MAKKFTFLLVMMFVLLFASVTALAAGTDSTTSEAGFTEDKAIAEGNSEIKSVSDLESKYGSIFFHEKSTDGQDIITVKYVREKTSESELRYTFTGSLESTTSAAIDNPVVMLLYIKIDGEYVALVDIDTGSNATVESGLTMSTVNLHYLGSDKVNDVRVIAFRRGNAGSLVLGENLQITDLQITVRPWNVVEKIEMGIHEVLDNLTGR